MIADPARVEARVAAEPANVTDAPGRRGNAAADREAADEVAAGVGIPIADIARWVDSWDTPAELPMPRARKVV